MLTQRSATRAARLYALYRLQHDQQLAGLSDIALAKLLGVNRTTAWKYRQALPLVEAAYQALQHKLVAKELI